MDIKQVSQRDKGKNKHEGGEEIKENPHIHSTCKILLNHLLKKDMETVTM